MLREVYRYTPTGRYVLRRRFRLVGTGSKDGKVVTEGTWSNFIRPGIGIAMNIVSLHLKASEAKYPKCKSRKFRVENGSLYSWSARFPHTSSIPRDSNSSLE
jgi:hypothetical protein